MERISIDKAKCTGCGACVEICPYRAIVLLDAKAEYTSMKCFLCGHCQAVCPVAAVQLPELPVRLGLGTIEEEEMAVPPGTTDVPQLVTLMRSRRSCRKYQKNPVSPAILEDLAKIGTTAPSGTNSQSWNFIILPAKSDLITFGEMIAGYYRRLNRLAANPILRFVLRIIGGDSLGRYYRNYYDSVAEALSEWDEKGTDRLFHGAVAAILVTGRKEAGCPAEDALLATQNILLAAHAMGLGSCLIGFAVEAVRRDPGLRKKIGLVDGEELYSVIGLGYPAVTYYRPANRKNVVPRFLDLTDIHPGKMHEGDRNGQA